MQSTRTGGYTPGWTTRSTGPVAQSPWGYNLVTKGRAIAGAWIGAVTADVGTIGTTELAAGAVTQPKLGSLAVGTTNIFPGAVTDAKRSYGWSTLAGAAAGTGTLPSVPSGYLITVPGTSKGCVFTATGTRFSLPTPGDKYRFNIDSNAGTTVSVYIQSTSATFDGTNKFLKLGENDQFVEVEAVSSSRWVVTSKSTGVTIAATT